MEEMNITNYCCCCRIYFYGYTKREDRERGVFNICRQQLSKSSTRRLVSSSYWLLFARIIDHSEYTDSTPNQFQFKLLIFGSVTLLIRWFVTCVRLVLLRFLLLLVSCLDLSLCLSFSPSACLVNAEGRVGQSFPFKAKYGEMGCFPNRGEVYELAMWCLRR